jgi:hypothetical protein
MSEEKKAVAAAEGAAQPRLTVDETGVSTSYANFFLVSASADEVMLLFGIRSPDGARAKVEDRIALTPANAKRVLLTLSQTLKRYEDTFGIIDLTPKSPPASSAVGEVAEQEKGERRK